MPQYDDCIGKRIRRIEHRCVNALTILFDDGTRLEFETGMMGVGGAGMIGTIERVKSVIPENAGQDPYDYE